jgi:hypothetical protein
LRRICEPSAASFFCFFCCTILPEIEVLEGEMLEVEKNPPQTDRRKDPRHPASLTLRAILISEPDPPEVRIRIIDTSRGGCCFNTRRLYRLDEPMAIYFPTQKGVGKLVLALVRHSDKVEAMEYNVGVEFMGAVAATETKLAVPPQWLEEAKAWYAKQTPT